MHVIPLDNVPGTREDFLAEVRRVPVTVFIFTFDFVPNCRNLITQYDCDSPVERVIQLKLKCEQIYLCKFFKKIKLEFRYFRSHLHFPGRKSPCRQPTDTPSRELLRSLLRCCRSCSGLRWAGLLP